MMFVAGMMAQAAVATAATPSAQPTLQARFEQATAALTAERWSDAVTAFDAIAARPSTSARTRSLVQMRRGSALVHLGRDKEAVEALRSGLADAPAGDTALDADRQDALVALGDMEAKELDYPAARKDYEAAYALPGDTTSRLQILVALARATVFDDNDAALRYIDGALKIAATDTANKITDGRLHEWRGRILLNRGDTPGALAALNIALKDFGGLTSQTDFDDVQVRADLALANLLANNKSKAREFLGMTGQGQIPGDHSLQAPADGDLPICGGDMKPDDVAVIQFGLSEEGAVLYAQPVYASRPGPIALQFAKAVYGLSWSATALKGVPPFYRLSPRLEVRCSLAPDRPSPLALLLPDVESWLVAHDAPPIADATDLHNVERLRAELAKREQGGADSIGIIPVLMALGHSSAATYAEGSAFFVRAAAIAAAHHAPVAVTTYLSTMASKPETGKRREMDAYAAALTRMVAMPTIAGDARSVGTLRLLLALQKRIGDPDAASTDLAAIVDDHRLDPRDPLRVGALLQLAAIKARQHDLPSAQNYYKLSGLNDQQCALVDAQPVRVSGKASESDYPIEAREWGLSGWARTEFDIKADGATEHVRTVLAYPAFVFGPAIEKVSARTKYAQTFRPEGGLGCGGETFQQGFRYFAH